MSIFGAILDKLRHHASPTAAAGGTGLSGSSASTTAQPPAPAQAAPAPSASAQPAPQGASAAGASLQNVDVDAVLADLAARKGGGGNYRQSIVDLLKLLDLDSSLSARKQLAQELDVHAAADGSAEQNIALHQAVMRRIAENGGKVPDSLRH